MVSFFGLKIGGDKKKPQTKDTKQPQQQQWKRIDQNTLGEGQFFGNDLKRPTFPSSRPGSVQSVSGPPALWNSPYAGPATTSSLVDLSVPVPGRKQSFSSLRAVNHTSDANLTARWANGSTVDLAPPAAFANSRPGTPSRPGTAGSARKKEWVNPLDVHFGKSVTGGSRPGTPGRNSVVKPPARSSVAPTEAVPRQSKDKHVSMHARVASSINSTSTHARVASSSNSVNTHARVASSTNSSSTHTRGASSSNSIAEHARSITAASGETSMSQTGYPSPPKSVSPISTFENPTFNKPAAPSNLRQVDVARLTGPHSPPSPASSVSTPTEQPRQEVEDDEEWATPVIQNVRAKRDTLTYHPPRRQSLTMELEIQEQQAKQQVQPQRQRERSVDEPWINARRERRFEVDEEHDQRPRNHHVEGLSGNFDAFDFGESVRTPTVEVAPLEQQEVRFQRSIPRIDTLANSHYNDGRRPSAPEVWHSRMNGDPERNDTPVMQRGRPRFGPPVHNQSWSTPSSPVRGQRSEWRGPPGPDNAPTVPPRAPSRPRAPESMHQLPQRQAGPPRAAAGAHQGNRNKMTYGPTALNPPPARGFQPQADNEGRPNNRAPPPRPLRVPGPMVDLRRSPDHPPVSPISPGPLTSEPPPTGDSEYFSAENTPPIRSERPPSSPYSRGPMEGDFPMHRGLPRGRRPEPPAGQAADPVSPMSPHSTSRWRQWRSSLMRAPNGESLPRGNQQPQEERDDRPSAEHGYALPNWDDFDERSDRHRSALPMPLTPYSPYSPWSNGASSPSITSATPPRLPSPTFPSLEKSISNSSEHMGKSFELFYEDSREHPTEPTKPQLQPQPQQKPTKPQMPLISPVANDFSEHMRNPSPRRVDAIKAPPRPAPITVAPSPRDGLPGSEFGMRSPGIVPSKEFSAGFI
ncbi:hypothetical protein HJFPF1_05613 [Paramyrothecium foliicola]|nr:hypothetical protein HJFPF1_05613 [Paramyrothecium foliicola]